MLLDWTGVTEWVTAYPRPLVIAGAFEDYGDSRWLPLAVTVRGGLEAQLEWMDRRYNGPKNTTLRLWRQPCDNVQVIHLLTTGVMGFAQLPDVPVNSRSPQVAHWITQGDEYGQVAPTPTPRLSAEFTWPPSTPTSGFSFAFGGQPVVARGVPYYPSITDALLDVLYGRSTQRSSGGGVLNRLELSLAYDTGYLGRVDYAEDVGIVVDVRGGAAGALTNAELHVRWEPGPSDSGFGYQLAHLNDAALITVPVERSPRRYWVALVKDGLLVDEISAMVRIPAVADAPLPATALSEAFADLDLAWRALFHDTPLLHNASPAAPAHLTQPVSNSDEFASRVNQLADLLGACRVDDALLGGRTVEGNATLQRIEQALRVKFTPKPRDPSWADVLEALATLQLVIRLRRGLIHRKSTDFNTALNRLGVQTSVSDWSHAWDRVRWHVVNSLRELRRVMQANLSQRPPDVSTDKPGAAVP